jgi:Flp pilus assembly protein TadB
MPDPLSPGPDLAKVYGEETRCPVCGAFARTTRHPDHRWVCAVCGAPRVDIPGEKLPEEATIALREATQAQRSAAIQRLTTWATGVPAAFTLLLAIVLAPASLIAGGVLVGMGVLLAVLSSRASRRASTERKRLRGAVERAWETAILHLAAKDKTVTEIGTALRIAEADVEAALATRGQMRIAANELRIAAEPASLEEAPEAAERAPEKRQSS